MKRLTQIFVSILGLCIAVVTPSAADTLDNIRGRGQLLCGTHQGKPGFALPDATGAWKGFDIDFCRALAAAIFDDPQKVKFIPLTAKDRFTAVQSGEVDVLYRVSSVTSSRETALGLSSPVINYYDGQGFIVKKALNVKAGRELNDVSVCVQQGTTTESNASDWFRKNGLKFRLIAFATLDEAINSYQAGRCDVFTDDLSGLATLRLKLTAPDEHLVLPDMVSKEPIGPFVRKGDDKWYSIVRWIYFAMVLAEELDITSKTLDEAMRSGPPEARRLLGQEGSAGQQLGLTNDWAYRVIRHVGNYGESFARNLGSESPLKIPRGLNDLWTRGGLQYALPVR